MPSISSFPEAAPGGLLFSMGLLGYIFSRSTISLVLGITPGLATLLLGTLSLKFWRSGRSSFLLILAQADMDLGGFLHIRKAGRAFCTQFFLLTVVLW
ncbi:Protein FATTY ACID EXPORT 1 chloroplastic [Zea mays]|uniref:Protein FATTY ACID EXPORT 1 chloroplastic n=1 Tax=Zea mays TaxID=4577 RepID=A0A1D6LQG7_MAIZE|nr:Protein FATTY ACID EXPORT 1 chloroplastic [Zea mays]